MSGTRREYSNQSRDNTTTTTNVSDSLYHLQQQQQQQQQQSPQLHPPTLSQQLRQPSPGDKVITCVLLFLFFISVITMVVTFGLTIVVWSKVTGIHDQLELLGLPPGNENA